MITTNEMLGIICYVIVGFVVPVPIVYCVGYYKGRYDTLAEIKKEIQNLPDKKEGGIK
jgi:hypothetical protein